MAVATPSVTEICLAAQAASRSLATMSSGAKDAALLRVADWRAVQSQRWWPVQNASGPARV